MEQPPQKEAEIEFDSTIDRRDAIAGLGFLAMLGLVLIGSIAYRVVDASRLARPGTPRQQGSSLGLASVLPGETSPRVETTTLEDPFASPMHGAQALDAATAGVQDWSDSDELPASLGAAQARFDESVLEAEHIEKSNSRARPRFVAPAHRSSDQDDSSAGPR